MNVQSATKNIFMAVYYGFRQRFYRTHAFNEDEERYVKTVIDVELNNLGHQAALDAPLIDTLIVDQLTQVPTGLLNHYLDCQRLIDQLEAHTAKDASPSYFASSQVAFTGIKHIEQFIKTVLMLRSDEQLKALLSIEHPQLFNALVVIREHGLNRWARELNGVHESSTLT